MLEYRLPDDAYRIRLLRHVQIIVPGKSAVTTFRSRRSVALLALLALKSPGEPVSRDWLAERLWPDEDPVLQRDRLRQTLAMLRADIGEGCPIESVGRHHLQLDATISTDYADFRTEGRRLRFAASDVQKLGALRRALQLYTGPFAPELSDAWAEEERRGLEAIFVEHALLCGRLLARRGEYGVAREILCAAMETAPLSRAELATAIAQLVAPTLDGMRAATTRPVVPVPLTPLFGREEEIAAVHHAFDVRDARCVTLLGPGGIGKTRLARDIARQRGNNTDVWIVSFATARSSEAIVPTILEALHAADPQKARDAVTALEKPLDRLTRWLRDTPGSLLLLDNLEGIVANDEGVASLLSDLLERVGSLQLLCTSRQAIGVPGEVRIVLGPLDALPARNWFLYQASAQNATIALDEETASIDALCHRLDGVPLAIELAASWVGALSPGQIVERLSLPLLARQQATGDPRHRTLTDCMDASLALLPSPLREVWMRLALFHGGWTLAAAEAVLRDPAIAWQLSALRDRSLITVGARFKGDMRFDMLETLRDYAHLQTSHDPTLCGRHCDHFCALVQRIESIMHTGDTAHAYALFEADDANIRAAIDFGIDGTLEQLGVALETMRFASMYWWQRGREPDVRTAFSNWARRAAGRLDECEGDLYAAVLRSSAYVRWNEGDTDGAAAQYREAIGLHAAHGNSDGQVHAMERLARLYQSVGDLDAAVKQRQVIAEFHASRGEGEARYGALILLAKTFDTAGRFSDALPLLEQCRDYAQRAGCERSDLRAAAALPLASILQRTNRPVEAEAVCREAVSIFATRGERWNHAHALCVLGATLTDLGRPNEARTALEESLNFLVATAKANDRADVAFEIIARANTLLATLPPPTNCM